MSIVVVYICNGKLLIKGGKAGAEEMAQKLRTLAALVENLASVPSTNMASHNHP